MKAAMGTAPALVATSITVNEEFVPSQLAVVSKNTISDELSKLWTLFISPVTIKTAQVPSQSNFTVAPTKKN